MNRKLTLNVDEQLIEFAHRYSKVSRQSISGLFEKYLLRLKQDVSHEDISSAARDLYGILDKDILPDKKEMRKEFYEKSIN
ncbi:MAG: DUF6364 family protein [Spirochaetia bacterium]|jgi:hypothetical protein|nr:DUF6364 family protein [Spirochaetia bacterium]